MLQKELSLQEYLSLGYVFLVVFGVISESVFYGLLDVPYLQYTSILDVLISPISILADNWFLFVIFLVFLTVFIIFIKQSPKIHEKNKHKKWYKKIYNVEKLEAAYKTKQNNSNGAIFLTFFLAFSMLIGFRLGMGMKYKNRLNNKKFKTNYQLTFKDNSTIKVKKIGQNSLYIFYVLENENVVTATPIADNLKQIKILKRNE